MDRVEIVVQRFAGLVVITKNAVVETRLHPAGHEYGDTNRRSEQVAAQPFGKRVQCRFRGPVCRSIRRRVLAGDRAHEEDVTPVAGDHARQHQVGDVQCRTQVDVDLGIDRRTGRDREWL